MRSLILTSLVVALAACAKSNPTSPSAVPTPSPDAGAPALFVSGTVRDAGNQNLLGNVTVSITPASTASQVATGFDGRFTVAASAGPAALVVTAPGYEPHTQQVDGAGAMLDVRLRRTGVRSVRCGAAPDAGNRILPLFSRPFQGQFRLTNYFDHDLPTNGPDGNGYQLTLCEERLSGKLNGHQGYDWLVPMGTPLLAVADGTVAFAGTDAPFPCGVLGRTVADQRVVGIAHPPIEGERFTSVYIHLSRIDVSAGQSVSRGQVIGLSGNTGCSTEPHLHLQVLRNTGTNSSAPVLVDPYGWEGLAPDPWAQHPAGAGSIWLWRMGEAPALGP